jgi:hypothetical protein
MASETKAQRWVVVGAVSEFSDYIVFVDESGSPTVSQVDSAYPIFVLVFCVINKSVYADKIQPAVERLKFEFFGHDMTILHARDIRKPIGDFRILQNETVRTRFNQRLADLIESADIHLIAQIIDKREWKKQIEGAFDPYHSALRLCLAKLWRFLLGRGQSGRITHIIAEARGKTEDRELLLEFHRFYNEMSIGTVESPAWGGEIFLDLQFASKKTNSAGLQLADLVAHPIGRNHLKPEQINRAFDILVAKLFEQVSIFP